LGFSQNFHLLFRFGNAQSEEKIFICGLGHFFKA
jgi:hypothetical protein